MKTKLKYIHVVDNGYKEYVLVRRFRHSDCKAIEIKAPFGSKEFFDEYWEAIRIQEGEGKPKKKDTIKSNTLSWLYKKYIASPEFLQQRESTQRDKIRRLGPILLEGRSPGKLAYGERDYTQMKRKHVLEIRDNKAHEGFPAAANNRVKVLSAMFAWVIKRQLCPDWFVNPAHEIGKLQEGPGHHTWTLQEQRRFEQYWPIGTMPRLAYELIQYTGARVSDAFRLGKKNEKNGQLIWHTFKSARTKHGVEAERDEKAIEVDIPIHPNLRKAIDATPSGNLVYVATLHNKPFQSEKSFSQWLKSKILEAGLPGHCVPHGLRKVAATNLAELGASEFQLMAVMGWSNPATARRYTEKAQRKTLGAAAIIKLN